MGAAEPSSLRPGIATTVERERPSQDPSSVGARWLFCALEEQLFARLGRMVYPFQDGHTLALRPKCSAGVVFHVACPRGPGVNFQGP